MDLVNAIAVNAVQETVMALIDGGYLNKEMGQEFLKKHLVQGRVYVRLIETTEPAK